MTADATSPTRSRLGAEELVQFDLRIPLYPFIRLRVSARVKSRPVGRCQHSLIQRKAAVPSGPRYSLRTALCQATIKTHPDRPPVDSGKFPTHQLRQHRLKLSAGKLCVELENSRVQRQRC